MNYYRKTANNVANDVKSKMQMGALTLKISENINKIDDLLNVDENIKKGILDNSNKIESMEKNITNNFNRISINDKNIKFKTDTINLNIDEKKSNLSNIDLNSNSKYSIENFLIHNIEIENSYTLNKDNPRFRVFNYDLVDVFRKGNILEINC